MFFLFGWGHRTNKDFGPTLLTKCPNCSNNAAWHLLRTRAWFTLFFIPVIPYESKHVLLCEVCSQGIELHGDQIEQAKQLNELTLMLLNEQMTQEEYVRRAGDLKLLE